MTRRATYGQIGCKPVRPKSIEVMAAAAGAASGSTERGEVREQENLESDMDEVDERDIVEHQMDPEEERELFGPSSGEDEPVREEGQIARRVARPPQPSKEEALQHELTHIPFRSWCQHCVKGKSKNLPHRRLPAGRKEERQVPIISMDYMYMDGRSPTLAILDEETRISIAQVVPRKGVCDQYIAKKWQKSGAPQGTDA